MSAVSATIFLVSGTILAAAGSDRAPPLPADEAFRLQVGRPSADTLRLEWTIAAGYYLYRDSVGVAPAGTGDALPLAIGEGVAKDDPTFGPTRIFLERAEATVSGPAVLAIPGAGLAITYQGCQEGGICYPPVTKSLDPATLTLASGEAWLPQLDPNEPQVRIEATEVTDGGIVLAENDGMVASLLREGGAALVLGSFLLFGMALAFTPCVFPMYPILAGVLAQSRSDLSPKRGFVLASAYVLAMASAFGLLGIAAAWSGRNLQVALQAPATILAMALVFVALALSMFGFYELRLPSRWVTAVEKTGRNRGGSLPSAALLGFTSALIVGPCVTAPLAGALLHIAQAGDAVLGAAALFALGLGKGAPLVIFGTLGAKALPKAGPWMESASKGFGLFFLAAAIWMVSRVLPGPVTLALWAALLIGAGGWLGVFYTGGARSPGHRCAAKTVGLAAFAYGTIMAVGAAGGASDPLALMAPTMSQPMNVQSDFTTVFSTGQLAQNIAAADGRPSLVYVTADWCITCAAIERNVLADARIRAGLAGFNRVRVDVSDNSPAQQDLMRSLGVAGPPTMFVVDGEAREVPGSRLVGDVAVEALLAASGKAAPRP